MKTECPQCHHRFGVVTEENKKLIEDEKGEDIKDNLRERIEDDLELLNPLSRSVPGHRGEEVNAEFLTYEYRFKCTHCGHEWTELKEEEQISKE